MSRTNEEIIALTQQLVRIESTKNNPRALHQALNFIIELINQSDKNITIERFEENNKPSLLAYFGAKRPKKFKVILNGHIDVVEGTAKQFKMQQKNGRLYGRGVYDMKAAVIVMTDLFCDLVDKLDQPIGLQIVTDEEAGGFNGTNYQIRQGVRADFVICGECGRADGSFEIASQAKGIVWPTLSFKGVASHSAYPWSGKNALLNAAKFISKINDLYPETNKESFVTTFSPNIIDTTNSTQNTLPDNVSLKFDIRYMPDDPNFKDEKAFRQFIAKIDPDVKITDIKFWYPLLSNPADPLIQQLRQAATQVEGRKFKLVTRHATSDGRFYTPVGGQACEFGIAGHNQHGKDESISIFALQNFHKTLQIFLNKFNKDNDLVSASSKTASQVDAQSL